MSRRYFGTDGVRGPYGGPLINDAFAGRLAKAAVAFFREKTGDRLKRVVIGRDTRASGEPLATAMIAALTESGLEVLDGGVVPTPAIAGAMEPLGAQVGVMITASHNPAADNGIKFFGEGGRKLTDAEEARIEAWLDQPEPVAAVAGRVEHPDVLGDYIRKMEATLPARSLAGWRIVVDAAHGATAVATPEVLRRLGADLELLGDAPDGANINAGVGSQHPERMVEKVRETGARIGIAHDGDGDRVVMCDETGCLLDGDDLLAILGLHALRGGVLTGNTVVATVQSNLGLDRALEAAGGKVVRANVGDRYVIEEMVRGGFRLGGESSGHVVLFDLATTGDGLAAALKVIEVMLATGEPLSRLRGCWIKFPQMASVLRVREKLPLDQLPGLTEEIRRAEAVLGSHGRVLIRYSGTEPVLRFLVEGEDAGEVSRLLERLESVAAAELT